MVEVVIAGFSDDIVHIESDDRRVELNVPPSEEMVIEILCFRVKIEYNGTWQIGIIEEPEEGDWEIDHYTAHNHNGSRGPEYSDILVIDSDINGWYRVVE